MMDEEHGTELVLIVVLGLSLVLVTILKHS